jgi:hypothetical protein
LGALARADNGLGPVICLKGIPRVFAGVAAVRTLLLLRTVLLYNGRRALLAFTKLQRAAPLLTVVRTFLAQSARDTSNISAEVSACAARWMHAFFY